LRIAELRITYIQEEFEDFIVAIVVFVVGNVVNRKVMLIKRGLKAYFMQNTLIEPLTLEG
jgi:hypothetical protein